MDLELGVKLTRASDEFDDFVSDFRLAKDRSGPLFLSRETYISFILTSHLKGYKRADLKIDINDQGTLMAISGEKQSIDTPTAGRKVVMRDKEIKGFKKVFRIPNGVILDKIKATFNEDESTLTISMPKKARGIRGTSIQQVTYVDDLARECSGNLQIVDSKKDNDLKDVEKGDENKKIVDYIQESNERDRVKDNEEVIEHVNKTHEEEQDCGEKPGGEKNGPGKNGPEGERDGGKSCKLCNPIVVGSTLVIVSFVVFVVHMVRSKNQSKRRKN